MAMTRHDPPRRGSRREARRSSDVLFWIVAVTGLAIMAVPLLHRLLAGAALHH